MSALIDVFSHDFSGTPVSTRTIGSKQLFAILFKLLCWVAEWRSSRADAVALRLMTDRDLRDMGLSRLDVEAISDGAYHFER